MGNNILREPRREMHEGKIEHNAVIIGAGSSFGLHFFDRERNRREAKLTGKALQERICVVKELLFEESGSLFLVLHRGEVR